MSLRTALAQHRELNRLLDEAGCQPTWRERLSMHVHPREWTTNLSVDRRIRQAIGGEREAVIARFAEERMAQRDLGVRGADQDADVEAEVEL